MSATNEQFFTRAQKTIPGGVNSPVRAFRAVGGTPRFIASGKGAHILDVEGCRFVDYVASWGPLILGHAHPAVVEAITAAAALGTSFGAPTESEIRLAETLCRLVPSMEQVRLVNSGTEATMSAIRLARGYTGKKRLVKFEGCYHGHSDALLVKAGSGLLTFGNPSSEGVPQETAQHTSVLPYNDIEALETLFEKEGKDIACVIVEPVAGNMNLVKPLPGFLEKMRALCTSYGALLIFDEVMTGFRVGKASAQGLFGIAPDVSTFGKVIGGGLPLAAFGGKGEVMAKLAPLGAVYQAGTLSGNPLAVAAGLSTLQVMEETPDFFEILSGRTQSLCEGLVFAAQKHGIPFCAQSVGGMFGFYFADAFPQNQKEVLASDQAAFRRFFHAMLERGHYFAPASFEAGFVSFAHTETDIQSTIAAADSVFAAF